MVDDPSTRTGLHALCDEPVDVELDAAAMLAAAGVTPTGPESVSEKLELGSPAVDAAPPVVEGPPASTVAYVRQLLIDYDATRPRSMQVRLGPSEIGTPCRRQIAAKLAGIPQRVEVKPPWAPLQGTAVHGLMEDVLRFENGRLGRPRWVIESDLTIATLAGGELLTGHGDAYDADDQLVVDWKLTGTTARRQAARRTVPNVELVSPEYRVQAHLYGKGHENAGRPVRAVRLVLLARSHDYDESVEWTEPYRPDVADWAIGRYEAIRAQVVELDLAARPDQLGEVAAAPSDKNCAWCPFLGGACEGNRPQQIETTRARAGAGLL